MTHLLSAEDEARIGKHVAEVERSTAGELVISIASRSSEYAQQRMAVSFAFTLLVAVAAYELVHALHVLWILCGQAPLMAVAWRLTGYGPILRLVTREAARREAVSARARQLFVEQGVTETRERSGVLLYLSEAERRLELLADRGIHERVGAENWQKVVDEVVGAIRSGHPADGITRAVENIGKSLSAHFPPSADDINELPDAPRRV